MIISRKELGLLIKKARSIKSDKLGLYYSQKLLAEDINKSQSFIGDIEAGRTYPSYVLLTRIAQACGVPMSFFDPQEIMDKDLEYFIDQSGSTLNEYKWTRLNNTCRTPEDALNQYLSCQAVQKFLDIDFETMTQSDLLGLKNDILTQMKLVSFKYKRLCHN